MSAFHRSGGKHSERRGDHHQHAEDKTAKFYLLQKDISRGIRKPQVSVVKKKKKIKHLLSSAAFNENHLRQKRRQEITIQDRLLRGEFVWQSTSPPPRGWAPPDSKSLSSSSGVEALAQRAELKEALGVEEPEDVISQEVGEVRNPPSAARARNPRASYPQPYTASLGS